jgi:hypothetical protein
MGTNALFNVNTAMKAMIATNAIEMIATDTRFALLSEFLFSVFFKRSVIRMYRLTALYRLTVPWLHRRLIISY